MIPQLIVLNGATLECWAHHSRLTLSDGSVIDAAPQRTPEYAAAAAALGFGSGPDASLRMSQAHDFLHAWVAQILAYGRAGGTPHSPLLHGIAHNTVDAVPWWQTAGEEALAAALTLWITTGTPDPWLAPLVLAGADLDDLRAHARRLLGLEPGQ